ncbi:hypothetical protein BN946_scf184844.g2 [Trametes cinnabarina]|uniref:B-related factor 1 n=1 Tax=Pycnoporus cinnabarinus TaxID=5643 RepID=A0A060SF08_PYCCI|nr:hypothetical protein BN946_scf184844.g2 [Trametes cinnabarina]
MTVCTDCGGTVIEYDTAAGNGFCVNCGTVVEENTIVNEVTFGETSTGAAMVQGTFVAQGASTFIVFEFLELWLIPRKARARMGGMFGNRGNSESREQTIANASRKIQQVATALRLSEVVALAATRLYTLAVEHKFTKGRKSMNVVAVCLYVACRQKETRNYMLIDFSDLLQVNVFELGHTYLQLVQTLNLRLPLVDPSHYISRFAALLEFGDETHQVAMDAIRLVQRFDRDWMTKGRRPAGICGACLLLAARMNNFRRSVAEIVQVVKIADTTLKKRLDEFRKTPSGALTLADFRTVWLEEEMDPPAYTKGKEKEEKERLLQENGGVLPDEKAKAKGKSKGKGKKKRKREDDEDEGAAGEGISLPQAEAAGPSEQPHHSQRIDPSLLNQGILAGTAGPLPLFLPDNAEDIRFGICQPASEPPIDPALLETEPERTLVNPPEPRSPPKAADSGLPPDKALLMPERPPSPLDETVTAAVEQEVTEFLTSAQSTLLKSALEEAERRRHEHFTGDDELLGLDEEELDQFILTEEEVRIKERVWVEMNRDYLEALAAKAEQQEGTEDKQKKPRKRRKTNNKPRDASTPTGATAAESVRNLIKKNPKYSKRINYNALKDLFTDDSGPSFRMPADEDGKDDDEELYTIDDKDEGEGMLIVEEAGGGVGQIPRAKAKSRSASLVPPAAAAATADGLPDAVEDEDAEGEEDVEEGGSDKDDTYAEWDVYEQEV